MSDTNSSSSSTGIGFSGLLTVLFVGLKLAHVISWSWLWVLSPLWIPFVVVLGVLLVALLVVGLVAAFGR
jgi:uncharacterized protein (DUF983 family)